MISVVSVISLFQFLLAQAPRNQQYQPQNVVNYQQPFRAPIVNFPVQQLGYKPVYASPVVQPAINQYGYALQNNLQRNSLVTNSQLVKPVYTYPFVKPTLNPLMQNNISYNVGPHQGTNTPITSIITKPQPTEVVKPKKSEAKKNKTKKPQPETKIYFSPLRIRLPKTTVDVKEPNFEGYKDVIEASQQFNHSSSAPAQTVDLTKINTQDVNIQKENSNLLIPGKIYNVESSTIRLPDTIVTTNQPHFHAENGALMENQQFNVITQPTNLPNHHVPIAQNHLISSNNLQKTETESNVNQGISQENNVSYQINFPTIDLPDQKIVVGPSTIKIPHPHIEYESAVEATYPNIEIPLPSFKLSDDHIYVKTSEIERSPPVINKQWTNINLPPQHVVMGPNKIVVPPPVLDLEASSQVTTAGDPANSSHYTWVSGPTVVYPNYGHQHFKQ